MLPDRTPGLTPTVHFTPGETIHSQLKIILTGLRHQDFAVLGQFYHWRANHDNVLGDF